MQNEKKSSLTSTKALCMFIHLCNIILLSLASQITLTASQITVKHLIANNS